MGNTAEAIAARVRHLAERVRTRSPPRASGAPQRRSTAGWFATRSSPVDVPQKKGDPIQFARDEYPRAGTTVEKLAALKPAFQKDGTVTAGNASGINDGAAALVVTGEKRARARGVRAAGARRLVRDGRRRAALMGMGPVPAVRKALDARGLAPTTSICSS